MSYRKHSASWRAPLHSHFNWPRLHCFYGSKTSGRSPLQLLNCDSDHRFSESLPLFVPFFHILSQHIFHPCLFLLRNVDFWHLFYVCRHSRLPILHQNKHSLTLSLPLMGLKVPYWGLKHCLFYLWATQLSLA